MDPPAPAQETPPDQDEMGMRVAEAEWLEEVGRSPQSSLTQQLAQMATEGWAIYIGWGGAS